MPQTSPPADTLAADSDWRDQRLWGYIQLIRPPNLFTVPGDPIAGLSLASHGFANIDGAPLKVIGSVLAALLLYMGGLVLNDWCDRDLDAIERPDRPIPSGLVPAGHALTLALLLLLGGVGVGIGLSALAGQPQPAIVAIAIALLVLAYNSFAKKIPLIGIPTMALCRSGSLLLGAASVGLLHEGLQYVWLAAVVLFIYIVLVSLCALHETERLPAKGVLVLLALFPLVLLTSGLQRLQGDGCPYVWAAWVLSALYIGTIVKTLWTATDPHITPRFIGHLIRNLIFMQAFWIAAGGFYCFWLAGILALWPLSGIVGRWFYSS